MKEYIEQYFNLLVNTNDINVVKEILPNINLDKTNQIIEQLIIKLTEEMKLAEELEDHEYISYLKEVIALLSNRKVEEIKEESKLSRNIIIFSHSVIKTIKKLNDSFYYDEITHAVKSLESKDWMGVNQNNPENYKRIHGVAAGLSEIKTKKIRLMHIPLNSDFWYVSEILKKDGDNQKHHQKKLQLLSKSTKDEAEIIRKKFTVNGELDYTSLIRYAEENNESVIEALNKLGGKKR